MRIAVCDDEKYFCDLIEDALNEVISKDDEICCFANGNDLIKEMDRLKFDIVYLDIEMPGIDGIEAALKLQKMNRSIIIIFVSSHTNFIQNAFTINAFQFLVKSASKKEIVDEYMRALNVFKKMHYRYVIKQKSGINTFKINQIKYIESMNRHLYLRDTSGNVHEYRRKLDDEEKKLKTFSFVRIHESYLVNMMYIIDMAGDTVILDKNTLPISRKFRNSALETFNFYLSGCSV